MTIERKPTSGGAGRRGLLLGTLGGALATGLATPALTQAAPLKIGILAPYTGVFATFGPKTIEAPIKLYLQERGNRLGGRAVELAIADDQSRPNVEVEKARELIESQKVDVIIGIVNSAGALAVRDYLDRSKIPTFITVAGAKEMTQSRKSDSVYRLAWANGQMEAAGAVLGRQIGLNSMAGIGADYVAARELLGALLDNFKALGGRVPTTLWSPLGTADFSSYLTQLKQAEGQVDAISPMLFGADGVRFLNQYKEFGFRKPLYLFGDVTEQTTVLDQVGEAALGAKAYWNYSPYLSNPVNTAFRIAYRKAFDRIPGAFSMHSWVAMQFVEAAMQKVGGNVRDFAGFKAALESTTVQSPAGPLSFDRDHNVVHNVYLTEVQKGPDGIVAQIPLGPVIPNVHQYQTIADAQANLTDISKLSN